MNEDFIEFGWEDEIENEGSPFILLPEGDYDFTVKKVERARHNGSEKVPPCNMAKVTCEVFGSNGESIEITENFFLCNKFEWKLSALFLSLGLKKHGEKLRMNWNAVQMAKGKCHVYIDTYRKKDGSEGQSNKIKKFYAYDEECNSISGTAPTNTYQQPYQQSYQQQSYQTPPAYQQPTGGWKPGNF